MPQIAFDAASSGAQGTGTSHTWSHTCSGADRFLVVFGHQVNLATVTVTYAGVTMNHIGITGDVDMWWLANPALGANNVVASWSGSQYMRFGSASYTGVDQVNPVNASAGVSPGTVSSVTGTLTTTKGNCWLLMGARGAGALTAGTNSTNRFNPGTDGQERFVDSNAARAVGSNSVQITGSSGTYYAVVMAIAPKPDNLGNPMFFGVGGLVAG